MMTRKGKKKETSDSDIFSSRLTAYLEMQMSLKSFRLTALIEAGLHDFDMGSHMPDILDRYERRANNYTFRESRHPPVINQSALTFKFHRHCHPPLLVPSIFSKYTEKRVQLFSLSSFSSCSFH
jgi:hypothetical protein